MKYTYTQVKNEGIAFFGVPVLSIFDGDQRVGYCQTMPSNFNQEIEGSDFNGNKQFFNPKKMNPEDFKKELAALLEKYNASISVELDGDTHCLSTTLEIEINNQVVLSFENQSDLTHYDLK